MESPGRTRAVGADALTRAWSCRGADRGKGCSTAPVTILALFREVNLAPQPHLVRITAEELDDVLVRAHAESWLHLVLIGPDVDWRLAAMRLGPLGTMTVFQLQRFVAGLENRLIRLGRLDTLVLVGHRLEKNGARAIAGSLIALTSLNLSDNQIGDEGARAVAGSPIALTSLNLSDNQIGDEGARAIARSLTALTSLNLSSLNRPDNQIGDEGARVIAGSLTALTSLNLSGNQIGHEGARAIAGSLTALTSLNLSVNHIGDEGARAIAGSLTALTSLNLSVNHIGDEGARAIAGSLTALTSLDLWRSQIGDEGARVIAGSLTALTSLNLSVNLIGNWGARVIAGSLTALTSLNLSDNQIGDEGARVIAGSLTALTSLNLSGNQIGHEGLKSVLGFLADAHRTNVPRHLDLRRNGDSSSFLPKAVLESRSGEAIVAAYRRFAAAQTTRTLRPLNELELLVVGKEAVGKTSLVRYLIDGKPRDTSETRTPGIALHEKIRIQEWSPTDCQVQLNVWDFGGQEMLRGTHRFFLTERSLYLLVLEDRRQDDRSVYEWMKVIRNRGGDSPVIVVINKSDEGKQDLRLDQGTLQEEY
jgi:Ran GTPase-activating protein (RanGAP) involved in mRNA processing and transport